MEGGTIPLGFPGSEELEGQGHLNFSHLGMHMYYALMRSGWNPLCPNPPSFVHSLGDLAPVSTDLDRYLRNHYGRPRFQSELLRQTIWNGLLAAFRRDDRSLNGDPLFFPLDRGAKYARETFGGKHLSWIPVLWHFSSHHHRVPQEAVRYLIYDSRVVFYGVYPDPVIEKNLLRTVKWHGGEDGRGRF